MKNFEKKIFSQHGEDGIIEFIASKLKNSNKTFLEIGYGHGGQNNTLNLSKNYGWSGVAYDCRRQLVESPTTVKVIIEYITMDSVSDIIKNSGKNIDFFSVDIDSIDFWLTVALLDQGLSPAFVCVELLNSAGTELAIAPPVKENFKYNKHYICGASIQAWKLLFENRKYKFLTVDSSGINAFFYKPEMFDASITEYPSIEFVKSKRNISVDKWLEYFSRQVSINECIVTGKETVKGK
jgi:hypothetical protein